MQKNKQRKQYSPNLDYTVYMQKHTQKNFKPKHKTLYKLQLHSLNVHYEWMQL